MAAVKSLTWLVIRTSELTVLGSLHVKLLIKSKKKLGYGLPFVAFRVDLSPWLNCSKSDESTTPFLKGSRDSPAVDHYNHLFIF